MEEAWMYFIVAIVAAIIIGVLAILYLEGVFERPKWELVEENTVAEEVSHNPIYGNSRRQVRADLYKRTKKNGLVEYKYVKR
jgi:hypothetical protein